MVFDASAKIENYPSLNDCTYAGPPLTPRILDILLRFREHKVRLVADIEKTFLNIAVDENQRNLMRFLWVDNIDSEDPNIEIYRFTHVIFGMNCSPSLRNATLKHHISERYSEDPEFANSLLAAPYVDDWTSGEDESRAYELHREANECFSAGKFPLKKMGLKQKSSDREDYP